MKDKHIILTARTVSMLFTPFLSAIAGSVDTLFFQLCECVSMAVQVDHGRHGLSLHNPPAESAHPCLSQLSGVDTDSDGSQGAARRALYHQHPLLSAVLLSDESPAHAAYGERPAHCGDADTSVVRTDQQPMENLHPLSRYRRNSRCSHRFLTDLRIRPHLVALSGLVACRCGGDEPHDSPPAFLGTSRGRIPRGAVLRHHDYLYLTRTIRKINKKDNMKPIISIIMGSTSDLPVMEKACKWLDEQEIPLR